MGVCWRRGVGIAPFELWRVSDGSLVRTLAGHADVVVSVSFSPDGSLLASGSGDGTIKLWRVSDGSLVRTLTGHTDGVYQRIVFA
jgi:WD40 repeat protein